VTETLRQADGSPLLAASVDLVNASGVVGHHLRPATIGPLIAELCRVLKEDGALMLDVGPTLPGAALQKLLNTAGFAYRGHFRSWFGDTTGEMVFQRNGRPSAESPA
jgi:SAM-dependent methyltransferase